MPTRNEALFPTPKLRAHRPRTDALQQPPSGDVQEDVYTEDLPKRPGLLALYWKYLVAGACLMLGFYLLMTQLVLPFIISTQEHWNYGYSRVSVYDFNVGHSGTSHFVAQYYKNQIASVSGFVVPVVLYNTGDSFRTGE
jgi:hypothetical protein